MTEREMFEEYMLERYKGLIDMRVCKNGDGDYMAWDMQVAWEMWQASANRQGYKLVPVEMSHQKADELALIEWGKNKSLFLSENRDMTALQVEEFRLHWCRNIAYQIMDKYKAMIGAIE